MTESAALLVDEVLPKQPLRQWVLSLSYPLRFLFASCPGEMGQVLRIVYRFIRFIATYLIKRAGLRQKTAQTGAVMLIQRFGSTPNLKPTFTCCFSMEYTLTIPMDQLSRFRWARRPAARSLRDWRTPSPTVLVVIWNGKGCCN